MHIAAPASVATSAVPSLTSIETSSVSADASNRALYIALAYMTFSTTHELEKIMQLLNPGGYHLSSITKDKPKTLVEQHTLHEFL
jgi:hypothetical protein